jgi:hypothetical protein
MRLRDLMLAALGGGVLLGSVLGVTTNTTMKPAPEPPWRQTARDAAERPQYPDATPRQDFSSFWSTEDRTPTWKRRPPEYRTADYAIPSYRDDAPAPESADKTETLAPRAEAAETGHTADDAATATPPVTVTVAPADATAPAQAGA